MPIANLPKRRKYHRAYSKAYSQTAKAKVLREKCRIARRETLWPIVQKLKEKPCADCDQSFHFSAMDFDHVRGPKKHGGVARIVQKGRSLALLLAEIAKCDLVCANCHRVRTWTRAHLSLVS